MQQRRRKVAIVGAGAAGIACFLRLRLNKDIDVTVFEARDRVGGRTLKDTFDLGASWIHGASDDNVLYRLVAASTNAELADAPLEYLCDVRDKHGAVLFHGKLEDASPAFERALHTIKDDVARGVGEELQRYAPPASTTNKRDRFLWDLMMRWQSIVDGGDLTKTNVSAYVKYCVYKGSHRMIKGPLGMGGAIQQIAAPLLESNCVRLNSRVTRINGESGEIFMQGEYAGSFDYIVCALPLGVLQDHASSLFSPRLECINELQTMVPGNIEKLILTFSQCFWSTPGGIVVSELGDSSDAIVFSSLYKMVTDTASMIVWLLDGDEGHVNVTHIANRILAAYQCTESVTLISHVQTHWRTDEFSRGTYGLPGNAPIHRDEWKAWQCGGRVTLAGEYLSDLSYGCVHGALQEGFAAADRLLLQLQGTVSKL